MQRSLFSLLLMAAALFSPSAAVAQGVSFQGPAIMSQVPQPIAGLTIVACNATATGTPCTPTVTVYSNSTLTTPIASLVTDGDGLIPTFFISPGQYQWCASDPTLGRIAPYCTKFTAPTAGGSSPTFVNLTVTGTLGVTGTSTLGVVNEGATTATTGDFSGRLNANGNGAAGNVALKYPTADHIIYVSPNGSDANDGLSMGTAKLTPQAAFNAATTSGTVSGTVILATGNYACPTTWYSNMEVHSLSRQYPFANVTDWGFTTTQSGALFGCTSGSNHVIGPDLTNLFIDGIGFNFANAGGGLVINSVSASRFEHVYVELAGSATQEAVQLKVNASSGVQHNTAKNLFNDLNILSNTAGVGSQANGLTLTGLGVVNAGVDVTDNWFTNLTIAGGLKNAIMFEKNTDSNYFSGVQINNTGTAQGDVVVFNDAVPGSDQDADGITLFGVASTGPFSHPVSMGQSSGNHIQIESAAEVTPNVLGGAPSYLVETIGLGGVQTVFSLNGLVRLTSSNVTGSDRIRIANGSAAGPSYSFAENPATGLWKRSTLNEVIFAANGVNMIDFFNKAMRIDGTTGGYFFANGDPSANAEDTGVTRVSTKKVAIGGTAVGDSSGTLKVAAVEAGGTAATLSGTGACSTNSTQTGGANGGRATCTAATAASTFVITPGTTAPNGWICSAFDQTTRANLLQQTSTTTGACTLTATSITQNDVIVFNAMAF